MQLVEMIICRLTPQQTAFVVKEGLGIDYDDFDLYTDQGVETCADDYANLYHKLVSRDIPEYYNANTDMFSGCPVNNYHPDDGEGYTRFIEHMDALYHNHEEAKTAIERSISFRTALEFGDHWFQANTANLYSQEELSLMENHDLDIFDAIVIDGQTLRERSGHKYDNLPAAMQQKAMETELVYTVLKTQEPIAYLHYMEHDNELDLHTITAVTREALPSFGSKHRNEAFLKAQEELNSPERLDAAIFQGFIHHQDVIWKNRQKTANQAHYQAHADEKLLPRLEKGMPFVPSISAEMAGPVFELASKDPAQSGDFAATAFEQLFGNIPGLKESLKNPVLQDAGITSETKYFFIDGKPVDDWLQEQDSSYNGLDDHAKEQRCRFAIVTAATDGRHRVELGLPVLDEVGNLNIQIHTVKPDLHVFDGKEHWYERSRAHLAERLEKGDSRKELRQNQIRQFQEETIVKSVQRAREERQYREGFEQVYSKTQFIAPNLTESFLGLPMTCINTTSSKPLIKLEQQELDSLPENQKESYHRIENFLNTSPQNELLRGGFGGTLALSALHLMKEHPEIRFADITDPTKFQEEKRQAGNYVMKILTERSENPEALGQLIAENAMVLAGFDAGKELSYVLNLPENLSEQERAAAFTSQENQKTVTAFMRNIAVFGIGADQALRGSFSNPPVDFYLGKTAETEPAKTVYDKVAELLSNADRDFYRDFKYNFHSNLDTDAPGVFNIAIKAFSGSSSLHNAETNLKLGDMLALTNSLKLLAKNGKIAALDFEDMKEIGKLEKFGNDIAGKLPGYTRMAIAKEGYDDKQYQWIIQHTAEVQRKELLSGPSTDTLFFGSKTKKDQKKLDSLFSSLSNSTDIRGLNRQASRASLAGLQMLCYEGNTIDDLLSDSPDKRKEFQKAGKDLITLLKKNPAKTKNGTVIQNSAAAYSSLFDVSGRKLLEEAFPAVDYNSPTELSLVSNRVAMLRNLCIDYDQGCDLWKRSADFQKDMKPGMFDCIQASAYLAGYADSILDTRADLTSRVVGKMMMERYGDVVSGKTVEELGHLFDTDALIMEGEMLKIASANQMSGKPEEKKKFEDYLNGGPCPLAVGDLLPDSALKSAQATAGAPGIVQTPVTEPAPQPAPKATEAAVTRRQVNLSDLLKSQASTRPRRNTQPASRKPSAPGMKK